MIVLGDLLRAILSPTKMAEFEREAVRAVSDTIQEARQERAIDQFIEVLSSCTEKQRAVAVGRMRATFCLEPGCGARHRPGGRQCQCWNDE